MTENNCKDYISIAEQMFIESLNQSAKGVEVHIFRDHLLTLKRK